MKRCGSIALVGCPNVGKSTLINVLIGERLSSISRKKQTTRNAILGIKTIEDDQLLYVDTPGVDLSYQRQLNRQMHKAVTQTLQEVDVLVMVVDRGRWHKGDFEVLKLIDSFSGPKLCCLNKVDLFQKPDLALPALAKTSEVAQWADIIPISAEKKDNIDALETCIRKQLPQGEHLYPEDQLSNRSERFIIAEKIREQCFCFLGDEIPYQLMVLVDSAEYSPELVRVYASIIVERSSQKVILVGAKGEHIGRIRKSAELVISQFLNSKVLLHLRVKVWPNWSNDQSLVDLPETI